MPLALLLAFAPPAQADDPGAPLDTWSTRTRGALVLDATTQVASGPSGTLVVAGAGTSLVLSPEVDEDAPRRALDAQLAPFEQAGIARPAVTQVDCRVAGQPATCLATTLVVAPGATMRLLAGRAALDGYTAICLDRKGREDWPAPCAGVIGTD